MPRTIDRMGKGLKGLAGRFSQIPTRLQRHSANNLGVIMNDQVTGYKKVRLDSLDVLDKYYDKTQYDNLPDWDQSIDSNEYIAVRKRKPRINYNVAKVIVDKVGGKITGAATFPLFKIEDSPDDTEFFRMVQKLSGFRRNMVEPIRKTLLSGACYVRYELVEGDIVMEWAHSKHCYPTFDASEELTQIEVRYVYEDPNDKDARGKFKKKWYRRMSTKTAEILYDNPEYREGSIPTFKEVSRNDHNLGWVQGEWLRTSKKKFSPDGESIVEPILDFIDDMNYSLSQTSQAVGYNQDPQLAIKNMSEDELGELIRSSQRAWNLGREGEANFIEADMKGVTTAGESRQEFRNLMLEVVRVVLHDPEKMVGSAQSAKALELLNAPLVELIDDLRTSLEESMKKLLLKMGLTILMVTEQGFKTALTFPQGYRPKSLDLSITWPPIYPLTIEDIQKKVMAAVQATTAKFLSRESATRWVAADFGIQDIDEEIAKIAAEPILNPFGTF
jgi:hypothetical protein